MNNIMRKLTMECYISMENKCYLYQLFCVIALPLEMAVNGQKCAKKVWRFIWMAPLMNHDGSRRSIRSVKNVNDFPASFTIKSCCRFTHSINRMILVLCLNNCFYVNRCDRLIQWFSTEGPTAPFGVLKKL